MSVIISDEPVKGYASVAPKLSTNLNWVTPLENKNSLVRFGYLVATKYPNLTREFLFSKGVTQFKLVDSLGATEAYPFTGSSEIITDITSTGETLKANNLRVLKDGEILKSEACMMISKSSFKNKSLQSLARLLSKN